MQRHIRHCATRAATNFPMGHVFFLPAVTITSTTRCKTNNRVFYDPSYLFISVAHSLGSTVGESTPNLVIRRRVSSLLPPLFCASLFIFVPYFFSIFIHNYFFSSLLAFLISGGRGSHRESGSGFHGTRLRTGSLPELIFPSYHPHANPPLLFGSVRQYLRIRSLSQFSFRLRLVCRSPRSDPHLHLSL
jgi:hypothetical protein